MMRDGHPLRESIPVGREVVITSLHSYASHLEISYLIDCSFQSLTRVDYPADTLDALTAHYSPANLRTLYCHIAFFEGLKYCLTFPEIYDVTVIADGLSQAAFDVFKTIVTHAWAQHMYENDVTNYYGPEIISQARVPLHATHITPRALAAGALLCANGGGKDSFLVMKLLEEAGIDYAMFQHARSEYGRLDTQHQLQRKVIKHLPKTLREHPISVFDDYTDAILASLYNPSLTGECMQGHPCQVGWPEMIFEALPFVLLHNYQGFVLGNERSADANQANWHQPVNHQWIKSNAACMLLNDFIQQNLLADFSVFSLLKPIHDQRIYQKLANYPDVLPSIHSCNVTKPWCKKCAKCAYVWVNLVAVFGQKIIDDIFGVNLFDDPDLEKEWQELLGLATHNAFECVGEIDETRLAFYRCVQLGCTGKAITLFRENILNLNPADAYWQDIAKKYNHVHDDGHVIPVGIYKQVKALL
jgi:hypothetical protein